MSSRQLGSRTSSNAHATRFEDCFRIYHEVEDVGKTVKATKRRARWTFSFGEKGQEREVILAHSVVSGKKIITYDGRQIHHSDDMSRTFSHSWFEGDHALRVDITDIVEVGRGRNDKMYELTLDGVPFGVLPLKPVHLPSRGGFDRQGSSSTRPTGSLRERDSFEATGNDFNPRASGSSKPRAVMKATTSLPPPASATPVVDLLGVGGGEDFTGSRPHQQQQQQQAFDPFSAPASGEQFADFSAGFNMAKGRANVTAHDLVKEFGSLSTASLPEGSSSAPVVVMPPLTYGNKPLPAFHYDPGPVTNGNGGSSSSSSGTSTALIALGGNKDDSGEVDVDKATASLVNLNNLLDDGTPSGTTSPTKLYSSVYADNRSLEEMKASRAARPPQPPAQPVFIERTLPPRPPISPYGMPPPSPLQQQQQQQQQWGPPPMQQTSPPPRGSAMMGGAKYVQQQQMQQQQQLQQQHFYQQQQFLQQQQLQGGMGGGMMQPPLMLMGGAGGGGMGGGIGGGMGGGMRGGMGGARGPPMMPSYGQQQIGSAMQVPVQMQMAHQQQQQQQQQQRYQQQGIPRPPKDPFFGL